MKIEELIEKYERLNHDCFRMVDTSGVLRDLKQLDELKTGHTDEAPRYVKNILARLRELPLHDREVWLKVIISEFKQDFSRAKWREGYEQGKVEGMVERDKVKIPQFVADWYEEHKDNLEFYIFDYVYRFDQQKNSDFKDWLDGFKTRALQTLVNMHQFGYEVEKEKRYRVKMKGMSEENTYLTFRFGHTWMLSNFEECEEFRLFHTRKELEKAGFSEVFNSTLFEVEEVEE